MANMGGISSEQSVEDEEEELRQAFRVRPYTTHHIRCYVLAKSFEKLCQFYVYIVCTWRLK